MLFEIPPNTQGIATLIMLKLMEGFDFGKLGRAQSLHVLVECKRLAYRDLEDFVGDVKDYQFLLQDTRIAMRRKLISLDRVMDESALHAARTAGEEAPADTTYITVAQADGLMVSLIQSNFRGFGSGVVLKGTGFMLQDRGEGFSLREGHPNCYAPGKRPFHTIIPAYLELPNGGHITFGLMGGDMQAQGTNCMFLSWLCVSICEHFSLGHAQIVHAIVDCGKTIQQGIIVFAS
jgi:gamma-glutamyltranspeptidase/glutathione hydrolase